MIFISYLCALKTVPQNSFTCTLLCNKVDAARFEHSGAPRNENQPPRKKKLFNFKNWRNILRRKKERKKDKEILIAD